MSGGAIEPNEIPVAYALFVSGYDVGLLAGLGFPL